MSIEPIGSIDTGTTSVIGVAPLYGVDPIDRTYAPQDTNGITYLTAGDREFLAAVYDPEVLAASGINQPGTPQFIQDLIEDRRNGVLPVGTEITMSYVQARYDAQVELEAQLDARLDAQVQQTQFEQDQLRQDQVDQARLDQGRLNQDRLERVNDPLTPQNLADARVFFSDRLQGAQLDLQV